MVAPALGMKQVAIVSRIGADFPPEYLQMLRSSGLHLSGVLNAPKNTLFINRYDAKGNRTQQAPHVAEPIIREDIPTSHWNTTWMHLSPILREVDSQIIHEAKCKGVKVSVDVQGFIRDRFSAQKPDIIPCRWEQFPEIAAHIDVLKADVSEICQLTQQTSFHDAASLVREAGCPLVLITQGQRGAFIYQEDLVHEVPAIPSQTVLDFTGSGDVFAISFLFELERTGRPIWSAFFASTVASFSIETHGPTGFPTAQMVTQRLQRFLRLPGNQHYLELILKEPGPGACPVSREGVFE
jgi:sugar/nucleoside kinase (ribokinase family)